MSDLEIDPFPQAPAEVIRKAGEIIAQLKPELLKALGSIATTGVEGPEKDFVESLADAVDEVQAELNSLYDGINAVPTSLSSEDPSKPGKETMPSSSYLPDAPIDLLLPPITQPEVKELVKEPSQLDTLSITPNERAAVERIINFLRESDGRQNMRNITEVAFGKRLAKAEEERLDAILYACSKLGLMEKYGKSYGVTDSVNEVVDEPLSQYDHDLLEYLRTTTAREQSGLLNIGQIVREFFGVQELDRQSFSDFITQINRLAGLGYVNHPEPAWYGMGYIEDKVELDNSVLPIITRAIGFDPEAALAAAKATEAEVPGDQSIAPSKPETEFTDKLDELETQLLNFVRDHGFTRIEELHREIPLIKNMSNEEYKEFKANFTAIRKKIIDYFADQGIEAKWEEIGRNRGKRYKLVIGGQLYPSKKTKKRDRRHTHLSDVRAPVIQAPAEVEEPQLTEAERRRQLRKAAYFTLKLTEAIGDKIAQNHGGLEKMSKVSKDVALLLGLPRPAAREIVRRLIRGRHLFLAGSQRGHWLLSAEKPAEDFRPRRNHVERNNGDESRDQWTEEDANLAIRILDDIAGVRYFEQGLQVKDLAKRLDVDESLLRPLLRRMHNSRYLLFELKARATRGGPKSRRTSIMVVRFESQEAKNNYRDERQDIIAEIRSLAK